MNICCYVKEICGSCVCNGILYLLIGIFEYDMEGIIVDNGNVNVFYFEVFFDDVKFVIFCVFWIVGCCVWRDFNYIKDK